MKWDVLFDDVDFDGDVCGVDKITVEAETAEDAKKIAVARLNEKDPNCYYNSVRVHKFYDWKAYQKKIWGE